jgi:tRNA (guanine-N7-)-methyltransferase
LGRVLIESALLSPGKNFLGLEVRSGAVKWIQSVVKGESLGNVQALWFSAVNGFPFLEDSSVKKVFYFFPDPWVKKRHNKRRAFSAGLLNEIHRVLKPDGKLYLMTDVPEVDIYQQEVLTQHGGFEFEYADNNEWDLKVRTNHEEFCLRKEIPFIKMICSKIAK